MDPEEINRRYEEFILKPVVEGLPAVNEAAGQLAGQEIQKFMGLHRGGGQIGPGNHLDTADIAPVEAEGIEELFAAFPQRENPQKQEPGARAGA